MSDILECDEYFLSGGKDERCYAKWSIRLTLCVCVNGSAQ